MPSAEPSPELIARLIRVVNDVFDTISFKTFFELQGRKLDDYTPILLKFPDIVTNVVRQVIEEEWLPDFLEALKDKRGDVGEVSAILVEFDAHFLAVSSAVPAPDPYEVLLVSAGGFANRTQLRLNLKQLREPVGPRFIMLYGSPNTGKSYSWHLLKHVAAKQGFAAHRLDFARWPTEPTPIDVIRKIVTFQWREDDTRLSAYDKYAQTPRQAYQLVDWFVSRLSAQKTQCWLFFDHLDEVQLGPEMVETLERLLDAATNNDADLRIVVASETQQPLLAGPQTLTEQTKGVSKAEVEEFFTARAKALGVEWTDQLTALVVSKVLAGAPAPAYIPLRLFEVDREIFQ